MHSHPSTHDRLGAAMLAGALAGFVVGAIIGLGSQDLAAPVVMPFAGALVGVVAAAFAVALIGFLTDGDRGRREASELEQMHARLRVEAHRGWPDGIDLEHDAPHRPRGRDD